MKSKIIENKPTTKAFPKLMKSSYNNTIVLFISEKTGMAVYAVEGTGNSLGEISKHWCPENFVDFQGDVLLSN